jgi:hypothetical protein
VQSGYKTEPVILKAEAKGLINASAEIKIDADEAALSMKDII